MKLAVVALARLALLWSRVAAAAGSAGSAGPGLPEEALEQIAAPPAAAAEKLVEILGTLP